MTVSTRSYLTAGMAAMVVGAMAIAPVQPLAPPSISLDSFRLSAAVERLANPVNTAATLLGVQGPSVSSGPGSTTITQPLAAVTANNAASDWVISAWNWADYWISYGADLTQYVLGWVWPLSLIGDQAPILWYNLGSPIGDATVYGLIAPVLDDPLNLAVWTTGLTIVAQTTVAALVNTAVAEFNYFVGWFLPPLPPLPFPPLPFAATRVPAAAATATARAAETAEAAPTPKSTLRSATSHAARPQAATQTTDTLTAATVTDATATASKTASSSKAADATSGKSASAKSGSNTAKKPSTAGSARSHGPKAGKAAN